MEGYGILGVIYRGRLNMCVYVNAMGNTSYNTLDIERLCSVPLVITLNRFQLHPPTPTLW